MARRGSGGEGGGESWLNTYADMVTLLLTFFVMLLSMSSVDEERFDAVLASLRAAGFDAAILVQVDPSAITEEMDLWDLIPDLAETNDDYLSMDSLYEVMNEYISKNDMSSSMTVTKQGNNVHIQFNSAILFEPDQYTMLPASRPLLSFVGDVINLYDEKIKVVNIGGHTARTGRGNTGVSDWRLSGERAATVATFLEDSCGVNKMKMLTIGYGDNFPIADNDTEQGRSQNRRVELVIVSVESEDSFDVYGVMGSSNDSPVDEGPAVDAYGLPVGADAQAG
ncbi:MAG: flagellar motor protein MotB [Clostridiales bacterium]|nr:flagellar motor protein MotB [Clostridiales bacterium]